MSLDRSPTWAVVRLTVRLIRRSTLLIAVAYAVYAGVEMQVMEATYPDAAARAALQSFGDFPALRIMQGVPYGVETGALVAWDAGWMMSLIAGVWVITTTSRLLRGDEEDGRSELVLAAPLRSTRVLVWQAAVLVGAACVLGLGIVVGSVIGGAPLAGSLLFGAALAGFSAAFIGLTAVGAQVFGSRTRVLGVSAALLGAALVLRMTANSADSRAWLAWFTPFGWIDHLKPFGTNRAVVLAVPLAVVVGLVACAVWLRTRRDSQAGLVAARAERPTRAWGLSSPLAFAWRANLGTLVGWAVGLTVWSLIAGVLVPSMNDFIESDPVYQQILATMGMDVTDLTNGFVAMLATIVGVALAVFAAWRIGAARAEEASGRLELVVTRPVVRRRWLAGHILLLAVSVLLLATVAGAATWAGAAAMGSDRTLSDSMWAVLNTVPAVVVFGGLAVLVLGLAPRATVGLVASTAVLAYVLQIVGPALDWPEAVVAVSPFRHLAQVPVESFEPGSTVALLAIGVVAAVIGTIVFERRDLVGA
ncbi:exporter of polyketide antibiotics [soil metagenome]